MEQFTYQIGLEEDEARLDKWISGALPDLSRSYIQKLLKNGEVLVDGKALDETVFGLENGITEYPYTSFELVDFPQTVPKGCIFVLGDNRPVSEDSRYQIIGMVDMRDVLGKAVFHVFPLHRFGPAQ